MPSIFPVHSSCDQRDRDNDKGASGEETAAITPEGTIGIGAVGGFCCELEGGVVRPDINDIGRPFPERGNDLCFGR